MKKICNIASKVIITILFIYTLGFFFLYPLFARYTVGENPGFTLALAAKGTHLTLYQPLLEKLGSENVITEIWYKNHLWWCIKINDSGQCEESEQ